MNRRAGFTIVELIITLTIMVILVTLSVAQLLDTLANARDQERKTDVTNIIAFQESAYARNNGSYFPSASANPATPLVLESYYGNIDRNNLRAPGIVAPNYSLVEASNTTQTTAGIMPKPLETTYVYQVLNSAGAKCTVVGACRKFNIYYLQESDATVQMLTSKNQ